MYGYGIGGLGIYGHGITQVILDEIELGKRVAMYLDSENNMPEVYFLGRQ